MFQYQNNELVPMTRRYPTLKRKVAERDSKIARKLIQAWDQEKDQDKVLEIYLNNKHLLSHYRYWELMRTVWIACGSVERSDLFRQLMKSTRPHSYYFSTPEEAKALRGLPSQVPVFRATDDPQDKGLSWTLSKAYAEAYMIQFSKEHLVELLAPKTLFFAYINRNKEEEIIIL